MYLPPFSPDYSGAGSILFDLNSLTVMHDAGGCTGNYTGHDEPRWYGSTATVFCSALRMIDVIMGNDEKLKENVLEAVKTLNPELIALVGSPVPMVIGMDLKGLALEIENTWTRYLAAKEQKKYYEEAIGYNTATRDAYLEQFKLGERSLLDVLDAESELFNSSTQYTTANGNVVVGAYRLYALTGMLLPELGIKEDPLYESPRNQQEKR